MDDAAATVQVGGQAGTLPVAGLRWARKPNPEVSTGRRRAHPGAPAVLAAGRRGAGPPRRAAKEPRRPPKKKAKDGEAEEAAPAEPAPAGIFLALEQEPKLQGALVSIDPVSGMTVAMVGGYDFEASEFNRAFQSCRQPGSAFKPLVYAAALERLDWTPGTVLTDAPLVFRDQDDAWKPQNFGEDFKGDVTLRTALVNSMNIPAVKTAEALTSQARPGLPGQLGRAARPHHAREEGARHRARLLLRLALGAHRRLRHLRPATATSGAPSLVKRVLDREGRMLEDHTEPRDPWVPLSTRLGAAAAEATRPRVRAIDERSAYQLVSPPPRGGHGGHRRPGGPAGQAGGRQDRHHQRLLRHLVHGLHPRPRHRGLARLRQQRVTPLARYETGGRAALPIWLDYMSGALRDRPQPEFEAARRYRHGPHRPVHRQAGPGGREGRHGAVQGRHRAARAASTDDAAPPAVEVQDLFLR